MSIHPETAPNWNTRYLRVMAFGTILCLAGIVFVCRALFTASDSGRQMIELGGGGTMIVLALVVMWNARQSHLQPEATGIDPLADWAELAFDPARYPKAYRLPGADLKRSAIVAAILLALAAAIGGHIALTADASPRPDGVIQLAEVLLVGCALIMAGLFAASFLVRYTLHPGGLTIQTVGGTKRLPFRVLAGRKFNPGSHGRSDAVALLTNSQPPRRINLPLKPDFVADPDFRAWVMRLPSLD